ncbi:MAG: Gx transporter family protein [Clostridia bacterium]|nr:Gx transporter family protein [Clostridia bacterium]
MRNQTQRLTLLALCASATLVLSYLEALLPPLYAAIPGIKMGLPNVVILFVLYRRGVRDAAAVSAVRLVAVALLFGNVMTLAYSVAGAILSLTVMGILRRFNWFSPVGVSVAGGVCHNVGQILVAMALLKTEEIGYYMPVLAITGTLAGILVGLLGGLLLKQLGERAD